MNKVAEMDPGTDKQEMDGEKRESGGINQSSEESAGQDRSESLEENLERLAALNLSNDQSFQPRFSTAMIRLVSAAAGIGALLLIYLIMRLFV